MEDLNLTCRICDARIDKGMFTLHLRSKHKIGQSQYNALVRLHARLEKKRRPKIKPQKKRELKQNIVHSLPTGKLLEHPDNFFKRPHPREVSAGAFGMSRRGKSKY